MIKRLLCKAQRKQLMNIKASKINYDKEKKRIKKELEDYFDDYTSFPSCEIYKKYRLVSSFTPYNGVSVGFFTDGIKFFADSDSIKELESLWKTEFFQEKISTTQRHFIADMKKRKVVKLLSIYI